MINGRDKLNAALAAYEKEKPVSSDAELEDALLSIIDSELGKEDGDADIVDAATDELLLLRGSDPEKAERDGDRIGARRLSATEEKTGIARLKNRAEKTGKPARLGWTPKRKLATAFVPAAVIAITAAAIGFAAVRSNYTDRITVLVPRETETFDDPADQFVWEQYEKKAREQGKDVDHVRKTLDLFDSNYLVASEEQRAKLDELKEKHLGSENEYEREIKIIMGELPEDTPRLTKEKAIEICKTAVFDKESEDSSYFEAEMGRLFDQAAGAPDRRGGSGIDYRVYYTDDSGKRGISVSLGCVEYFDEISGTEEILLNWFE